ncbi:MAG TPA: hypothetical protein VG269_04170 [Tepidisphaeraceae bacterium]|jgi:hypothetical protein|nr:hypothetical protein [Tepidisphaeraceae bacterium]
MRITAHFARSSLGCTGIFMSAAVAGLSLVSSARATSAILTITQSGLPPVTILDGGAGDSSPAPGTITWQQNNAGGFNLSFVTAFSNSPGDDIHGQLSQSQFDIRNTSANPITMTVSFSDSGFASPVLDRTLSSDLTATLQSLGANDFVSFQSSANSTSTPLQTLSASGDSHISVPFTDAGAYSLDSVTTLTLSPGATAALSESTTVTPEPAFLGFTAFLGLGLLARRRASSSIARAGSALMPVGSGAALAANTPASIVPA